MRGEFVRQCSVNDPTNIELKLLKIPDVKIPVLCRCCLGVFMIELYGLYRKTNEGMYLDTIFLPTIDHPFLCDECQPKVEKGEQR